MTVLRRLPLLVLVFLVWVPPAFAWSRPVEGPVLRPFAYDQSHPYAAGQHRGIDIGADSAGESVVAPAAGTVSFAGAVPTSGNCVTIETEDGYSVTLTHLGSIGVAKGVTVAEGDAVGTVGPSGTPELDGAYVHLGIRVSADPLGYVDPLGLLPPLSPPPAADDSGSAGASTSGAAAGAAAPPPALAPSTAPGPDGAAASANSTPASSSRKPIQADPIVATGEAQRAAGRRKPAPPPHAPSVSGEFADLPGSADRTGDGEATNGDSADPGTADGLASDPVGAPGEAAPPRGHSPRGHASETPAALPVEPSETWAHAGRRLLRSPVSEPRASRPQHVVTPSPLSLVLGIGPGLLALMLACAAFLGRARRRAAASAIAGAAVIRLPQHRSRRRHERRAA